MSAPELSPRRRQLLKLAVAAFLAPVSLPGGSAQASDPSQQKAFAAFLDTLLPRDALSGSATDLGVDQAIWELATEQPLLQKLLVFGSRWLDNTGGPPFAELDEDSRIAIADWMSKADWNEIPGRFFHLVRHLALEFYYSQPDSWAGLPLDHPPQPNGFPPPWT